MNISELSGPAFTYVLDCQSRKVGGKYEKTKGIVSHHERELAELCADTELAAEYLKETMGSLDNSDCSHLLELSAEQAKASNADVSEADLSAVVAEAIQWAREH